MSSAETAFNGQLALIIHRSEQANYLFAPAIENKILTMYRFRHGYRTVSDTQTLQSPAEGLADMQLSADARQLLLYRITGPAKAITEIAPADLDLVPLSENFMPGTPDNLTKQSALANAAAVFSADGKTVYFNYKNAAAEGVNMLDIATKNISPVSNLYTNLFGAAGNVLFAAQNTLYNKLAANVGTNNRLQYAARNVGTKFYELNHHLGNICAKVSDLRY
ncbi:MAG TPA: hypothetical protein DCQ31_08150 [Bacteroidales bacterium]|nr:hypothetical protein [Bacteroidales bacterium]